MDEHVGDVSGSDENGRGISRGGGCTGMAELVRRIKVAATQQQVSNGGGVSNAWSGKLREFDIIIETSGEWIQPWTDTRI